MEEMFERFIGKEIQVFTLDGNSIKGKVTRADTNLLGINEHRGDWVIKTSAIVSLFISKENE